MIGVDARCGDLRARWPTLAPGAAGRHAAITIGHSGHRVFEKTKHDPHALDSVERRDKMHFRCAGIAETDVDS